MRRLGLAALLALAACTPAGPIDLRVMPEWGCLSGTIAGAVVQAATPAGPPGRALDCWRDNRTMPAASFRAADTSGEGQVTLTELLAMADKLFAGRESLSRAEAAWLSDGQVRRLDPDNTGRITLARLRVAMAQDFTRADRDGSATLTPGRWPLD